MTKELWTVVMKRGAMGDKKFAQESEQRARQRADALMHLHGVNHYDTDLVEHVIVINASEYYGTYVKG